MQKGGIAVSEIYFTLADELERLAIEYRALATKCADSQAKCRHTTGGLKLNKSVSIQDVSDILVEKSNQGKSEKIKALLIKYNAQKLVNVKPEDYAAIFEEAKKL